MKRIRPSIVSIYLDPATIVALKARAAARGVPMRHVVETALRLYLHLAPAELKPIKRGIASSEDGRRWANLRWERVRARRAERLAEGAKKELDKIPEGA